MRVAVLMTDGSEEMEAVITVDVLRRAGIEVSTVGMNSRMVTCSRDVMINTDIVFDDLDDIMKYEALVLPGGLGGAERFMADPRVIDAIRQFHQADKLICAICAAPLVLEAAGILSGRTVTCHPSVADRLSSGRHESIPVKLDGNILTSQGPGTAFEFALKIIALLMKEPAALQVRKGLVLK